MKPLHKLWVCCALILLGLSTWLFHLVTSPSVFDGYSHPPWGSVGDVTIRMGLQVSVELAEASGQQPVVIVAPSDCSLTDLDQISKWLPGTTVRYVAWFPDTFDNTQAAYTFSDLRSELHRIATEHRNGAAFVTFWASDTPVQVLEELVSERNTVVVFVPGEGWPAELLAHASVVYVDTDEAYSVDWEQIQGDIYSSMRHSGRLPDDLLQRWKRCIKIETRAPTDAANAE